MISYIKHPSPVGELLLAATETGLCGIYFEQHRHFKGSGGWTHAPGNALLKKAAAQLDEYFAGHRNEFDLPLDLRQGTAFQQQVWQALCAIPFGRTTSYGEHAQVLGNPKALRAVGAAIGKNPVSIIVPCHRVIGATRSLTGYAGGLERKQALLTLEGVLPA